MSDELKPCPFDDHCKIAEELYGLGWRSPNDAQWDHLRQWCDGISIEWNLLALSRGHNRDEAINLRSKLAIAVEALELIHSCTCYEGDHKAANPHCEVNITQDALVKIRS